MLTLAAFLTVTQDANARVRQPGEWEDQSAVWMSYATYDHRQGLSVARAQREIVRALRGATPVRMLVQDAKKQAAIRTLAGLNVQLIPSMNAEIWIRDFGPTFLRRPGGSPLVATYRFDFWGYGKVGDASSAPEDAVDEALARRFNLPVSASEWVSEGGNRESNGNGTYLMTAAVERRRSPGKTLAQIEAEHARVLGARKILWLPEGVAEGDLTFEGPLPGNVYTVVTTGGHVDNVARFVNPTTILLAEVDEASASRSPIARISRARMEENARVLKGATDADGKPLKIVRMPAPEPIVTTLRPGDPTYDFISTLDYKQPFPKGKPVKVVHAASYLNFLVSNGVVVTSRFYKPGRPASLKRTDAESVALLKRVFPGRKIVALDTDSINLGGGGIHGCTQPQFR